jgi:hypothetical protein
MKNRMREIRTSGSVRDGVGNNPVYSAGAAAAADAAQRDPSVIPGGPVLL